MFNHSESLCDEWEPLIWIFLSRLKETKTTLKKILYALKDRKRKMMLRAVYGDVRDLPEILEGAARARISLKVKRASRSYTIVSHLYPSQFSAKSFGMSLQTSRLHLVVVVVLFHLLHLVVKEKLFSAVFHVYMKKSLARKFHTWCH